MNKQELIEKIKDLSYTLTWNIPRINREIVIDLIEQLDEPQKPVIPQIIADYIKYAKENDWDLQDAMDSDFIASEEDRKLLDWFYKDKNMEILALAWINGYTVEEKRYRVSLKNGQPLLKAFLGEALYFSQDIAIERYEVTRKQLEKAGFGWVLDCPGIEIEEVKG